MKCLGVPVSARKECLHRVEGPVLLPKGIMKLRQLEKPISLIKPTRTPECGQDMWEIKNQVIGYFPFWNTLHVTFEKMSVKILSLSRKSQGRTLSQPNFKVVSIFIRFKCYVAASLSPYPIATKSWEDKPRSSISVEIIQNLFNIGWHVVQMQSEWRNYLWSTHKLLHNSLTNK